MLLKQHLWIFAWSQRVRERPGDAHRAFKLDRRIAAFFGKAVYHTERGFDSGAPD